MTFVQHKNHSFFFLFRFSSSFEVNVVCVCVVYRKSHNYTNYAALYWIYTNTYTQAQCITYKWSICVVVYRFPSFF